MQVGMGDGDGALRDFGGLDGGAVGGMAHVHHQPDAVHFLDDLAAHAGDAGVFGLVAAGRQQRLVVVAELHEAQAQLVQHLDEADIVLDGRGVLRAKEDRGAAGGAGGVDIARPFAVKDQVGILFEPAVPAFDIEDRFAEILVIGDGDMHRVHAALAHLAKDLFGPIGILQAVYTAGHAIYSGVPAAM